MSCNKMVTPLTKDFGRFFIPCFDFRLDPTQIKKVPNACQEATTKIKSFYRNQKDVEEIESFEKWIYFAKFKTNALSTQLLNYHLGNTKGYFMGEKCAQQPVPTIVLHLRSGDIMITDTDPHAWYGQPPLEYYVKAVEHSRAKKVIIFSEDMNAPLADALKNYNWKNSAANHVSNVELRVKAHFNEVVEAFMCAESVVCAQYTICTLFSLSANLRTIYCPTDSEHFSYPALPPLPGIMVEYFWKYNLGNQTYSPFVWWKNSPEQRQEMLSFRGGTFEPVRIY